MKKFQETASAEREKEARTRAVDRLISEGEAQLDQRNAAAARSLFERAIQLDPDNWYPHGYLAEMFLASGELDRAYANLAKMEKIDPDSVVGNYLMAQYWVARKNYERARPYAEKAKFGRPGNSELRGLLGNIYLELGQIEKAREEFQSAVRLAPDRAEFREQLRRVEAGENLAGQDPVRQ
jgi:Flp pilus assembly protein TadD